MPEIVDMFNSSPERLKTDILRPEAYMADEHPSPEPAGGFKKRIETLERKYGGIFRIAKFAVASGTGFLITEIILVVSIFAAYHTSNVPSSDYSSPAILGMNALSFGIGVTAAFLINEKVTVAGQGEQRKRGVSNWFVRWGKYQLASLLGNIMIVIVQLVLLATFSLSPIYGNIIGAIVSYPVTYLISMRFVWRIHPLGVK